MRSMRRQIARHIMELAKIEKINKKRFDVGIGKPEKPGQAIASAAKKKSYFALHWKAYLDPESDERKALHAKLRREFAMARHEFARRMRVLGARRRLDLPIGCCSRGRK